MVRAQFQDNFTDGDFVLNPMWVGDPARFVVEGGKLRLNAPAVAETSYLSVASEAIHNGSWEFLVELGFATSSTSLARVYLVSDQSNLSQPLNGYFVMIGNADDEVSLYRQTGSTITKIIDGLDLRVATTTVSVKIKVTRTALGFWQLWSDVGNIGTFVEEASGVTDLTHSISAFAGVHCTYIASRSTLFWFDDFVVSGTVAPDVAPPSVVNVAIQNATTITITFNESVHQATAQVLMHYLVGNQVPIAAAIQEDGKSVSLTLEGALTNGLVHSIKVMAVEDLNGNKMADFTADLLFFEPKPVLAKDIIISEFMADPTPPVGQPEAEFAELHNRSANPVNLQNWKLTDGANTATLPFYILLPQTKITITTTSAAAMFPYALGVPNFPSLNNAGDNIILKDDGGITIDSIYYSTSWYHSEEKQDGGWSIEIVDTDNLCEEAGNWTASEDASGGTPGTTNSMAASNPDVTAPQIVSALITGSNKVEVIFNEKMSEAEHPTGSINPTLGVVESSYTPNLRQLNLYTATPFGPSTPYTLLLQHVFDCTGNALETPTISLVLPEAALAGDVVLNEVLFNPKTGGADFVEVYNTTTKYISLKKWALANVENDLAENSKTLEGNWMLEPQSYLVFSAEPSLVQAHYPRAIENALHATTLPSLPDDEGTIALVDSLGQIMDFLMYSNDFHSSFLKDTEGISLERISPTANTNTAGSWHSASKQENFATPGYKNSALIAMTGSALAGIRVEPEVFSPQEPSTNFTLIHYQFAHNGNVANVQILDTQGRLIKSIAHNEVLNAEGFFRWDGDTEDGTYARPGYYVVWFEFFNDNGNVRTSRQRVVVGR